MIKIELIQDTYNGRNVVKKVAKISTTHFSAGETFKFTPTRIVWSGAGKYPKKDGSTANTNLCELKYDGEIITSWQNDDSAFFKIFKNNIGREVTIQKVMKETSKGNPYYTFEIVGNSGVPTISLGNRFTEPITEFRPVNYEEHGVKFSELDVINAVRSANEGNNANVFVATLMKYGVDEARANFLFENRSRIE